MNSQERKDYVARFGPQDNVIRLVSHPADLRGIGIEYLLVGRVITAKYVEGIAIKAFHRPLRKATG